MGTWGYTTLKRLARREPELVFSEELKPGERIIISNDVPTLRRQRSAATAALGPPGTMARVKVLLRNPRREVEVAGPISVVACSTASASTASRCS